MYEQVMEGIIHELRKLHLPLRFVVSEGEKLGLLVSSLVGSRLIRGFDRSRPRPRCVLTVCVLRDSVIVTGAEEYLLILYEDPRMVDEIIRIARKSCPDSDPYRRSLSQSRAHSRRGKLGGHI